MSNGKSVPQVCTIRHIAARRMSPSAMFLHTPVAAHDARRSAYKILWSEARTAADLRPDVSVIEPGSLLRGAA